MDMSQILGQSAVLAALVWATVQLLKKLVPDVDPRALALVIAAFFGAVVAFGLIPMDKLQIVGIVILASLGSSFLHNKMFSGDAAEAPPSA